MVVHVGDNKFELSYSNINDKKTLKNKTKKNVVLENFETSYYVNYNTWNFDMKITVIAEKAINQIQPIMLINAFPQPPPQQKNPRKFWVELLF
jgi:hypothetical protein